MRLAEFAPLRDDEGGGGGPENSTIRQMREHAEKLEADIKATKEQYAAAEAARKEAEAKHKSLVESRMADDERTKAQLEEANKRLTELTPEFERLRKEKESSDKAFEGIYKTTLETAPEDKREALKGISDSGDWATRLGNLNKGLALMGSAPAKIGQPGPGGPGVPTVTDDKGNKVAQPATPADVKTHLQTGWGGAFKQPVDAQK